jgi:uncharacterized protein
VGTNPFTGGGRDHGPDHRCHRRVRDTSGSYLQAIGLEKEGLVQALGLSFTVSTMALAFNVAFEGGLRLAMASDTFVALVLACVGMCLGQAIRLRMSSTTFQRWFFAGLLLLGSYLIVQSVV